MAFRAIIRPRAGIQEQGKHHGSLQGFIPRQRAAGIQRQIGSADDIIPGQRNNGAIAGLGPGLPPCTCAV